jgi:DNA-binding transcriptional MocR family regulator
MIHQLLAQWGRQGLDSYVRQLQQRYSRTAAVAEAAAAKHLADVAEWQPIKAGMFMWVKIKGELSVQGLGMARHAGTESALFNPDVLGC